MSKTNLFIAGFAKSGTTVLYRYLLSHPETYCNQYLKEPRFFSYENLLNTEAYSYILKNAVKTEKEYMHLYEGVTDEPYIVDGSVYYSCFQGVANKIKKWNPSSKIILILRNPVDRFISHYLMHIRNEGKKESIEQFIKYPHSAEGINLLEVGNYYNKIKEYYDVFGEDNVYVALFNQLESNPKSFYEGICKFLHIDYYPYEDKRFNPSLQPKNKILVNLLNKIASLIPRKIILLIPIYKRENIHNLFYKKNKVNKGEVDNKVKKQLKEYYLEDVIKTASLIKEDLSLWLGD